MSDPIRRWREEYARRLLELDFEPVPDTPFHSRTESVVDGMRMVKSSFSPGFTMRDDELVKSGDDSLALVIARSRQILVDKPTQNILLGRGDAALLRTCEPGLLGARQNFEYVAMMVPHAELERRLPAAGARLSERVPKSADGLHLLRNYIRSLEAEKRVLSSTARATLEQHFFDLTALAFEREVRIGESTMSAVAAVAAARLHAAQDMIRQRLGEPDLSIASVAGSLGVSPRYLQRLFTAAGTTFTDYLNVQRLDRALAALSNPQAVAPRISDVALDVGYSDLSYFVRLFKRRFGDSPSAIRAGARADNDRMPN